MTYVERCVDPTVRSFLGGTGERRLSGREVGVFPGHNRVSGAVTGGYVPKARVPGHPNIFFFDPS
jgi:hypothetical protein